MVKSRLSDGESLNIGGYVVRNENNRIITDRSAVIRNHTEICNTFETPALDGAAEIEAYADGNMIEVFVNNGEYVITNAVYDLSDELNGNAELFGLACAEE